MEKQCHYTHHVIAINTPSYITICAAGNLPKRFNLKWDPWPDHIRAGWWTLKGYLEFTSFKKKKKLWWKSYNKKISFLLKYAIDSKTSNVEGNIISFRLRSMLVSLGFSPPRACLLVCALGLLAPVWSILCWRSWWLWLWLTLLPWSLSFVDVLLPGVISRFWRGSGRGG